MDKKTLAFLMGELGRSRSPKKLAAVKRNLKLANAARRNGKPAPRRESP
jgi:hypothetical protein